MFTPNDLARILETKERDENNGWTVSELAAYWDAHVVDEPECDHHCCCCCRGLAAGEHF